MNYRRGLQRLYVLIVVCWTAFVLFATQSGRWKPWPAAYNPGWDVESITPIASSSGVSDKSSDQKWAVTPEQYLRDVARQENRRRAVVRWSWIAGYALAPINLGHFLLFFVTPWIYRGFAPTHK